MVESPQVSHEPPPDALRWVAAVVGPGAVIQSVSPLAGGTSSALHSLEVCRGGCHMRLVLRRFVNAEWLAEEPDVALHEAASLKKAGEADVPTPELIAWDQEGDHGGVPAVLMTQLPGSVELKPVHFDTWLDRLAEALVAIHAVEAGTHPWSYFPYSDLSRLEVPGWSGFADLWERAIQVVTGPRPPARECFIHRDYHPTNVLWQHDRISGVVDWANACRGPAGIDLGHCRTNLARLYGVAAADRFLQAYQSLAGPSFTYHPYWDLITAIDIDPGPPTVYDGWVACGVHHLNAAILRERVDQYLVSVMARL
jgi:aminoglycoside phosphotransferase (APT) family kinase protein